MGELPIADELNYWKSGKSSPESWLDKVEKMITDVGGTVNTRLMGRLGDYEGIMFGFRIGTESYKITWPVLPPKNDKDWPAARRQAATMVYHDTKAKMVSYRIFGPKVVFSNWLVAPDGKTLAERVPSEIANALNDIKLITQ